MTISSYIPKVSGWRKFVSGLGILCLVVAVFATPVSVLTWWGKHSLLSTSFVVSTYAPLAKNPEIQQLIVTKSSDQIMAQLQINKLKRTLTKRINAMEIPQAAKARLQQQQTALINRLDDVVLAAVTNVVHSDTFVRNWKTVLRASHEDALQTLRSSAEVGTPAAPGVGVQVGAIAEAVVARMQHENVVFADQLPTRFNYVVPVITSQQVSTLRPVARFADTYSLKLVLFTAVLYVVGFLLVRRRWRKLLWSATAVLVGMALVTGFMTTIGNAVADMATGGNFGTATPLVFDAALQPLWPIVIGTSVAAAAALIASWVVLIIERRRRLRDAPDDPPDNGPIGGGLGLEAV